MEIVNKTFNTSDENIPDQLSDFNIHQKYIYHDLLVSYNVDENNSSLRISDLKIGDLVDVCYYPYSQKYLLEYEEKGFRGCVCKILSDDVLFYYDNVNDNKRTVKSLKTDGCNYGFSNDPCYWYTMKKLTKETMELKINNKKRKICKYKNNKNSKTNI